MDQNINSPKYLDIIKTAKDLFWKHGIRRVNIEEICKEAQVSKMTFYRFFSNKIELAKTIIQNMFDESYIKYRNLMDEDIPFEEKVKKQILAKFEGTNNISQELIKDIYTDEKLGLHEYWQKRTVEFTSEVIKDFTHAQEMGWMRKNIKLDFILYFNSKMVEMIYDPNLLSMYNNTQELIMEITNLFFYGIFPKEK
jgi:AcrR family transcriptional regulator